MKNAGVMLPLIFLVLLVASANCHAADIQVIVGGNGASIPNGDENPTVAKGTDFGGCDVNFATASRWFTIYNCNPDGNCGVDDLFLTGTPLVDISGPNSSDFQVVVQPAIQQVGPGQTTVFLVNFDPSDNGLRRALVSIPNSVPGKNPFTFAIQGNGTTLIDIILDNQTVVEKALPGSRVGTFSAVDQGSGSTFTYQLVSGEGGTDNASFTIQGNELRTAEMFDLSIKQSYSIRVTARRQDGWWGTRIFTITVTPGPGYPLDIQLSCGGATDLLVAGTTAGTLTTGSIMDGFTYSLVGGEGSIDNASFAVVGDELQTAVDLTGVEKPSYQVRVRYGRQGVILAEKSITVWVQSGNTSIQVDASYQGVWGASPQYVFAVGAQGLITLFNGCSLSSMNSGTDNNLHGIWGSSASDVYAVGDGGTILHYDGSFWSSMNSGTSSHLHGVWGSSAADVFVVGDGGLVLHGNGTTWSTMQSGIVDDLRGIWGTSPTNVYALDRSTAIYLFDGFSWREVNRARDPQEGCGVFRVCGDWSHNYYGIWGSSATDIFAAGYERIVYPHSESNAGTIRRYDGSYWQDMMSPTKQPLHSIWGSSASDIFAVGNAGTILYFDGDNWTPWSAMLPMPPNNLYSVWAAADGHIFAAGDGVILRFSRPAIKLTGTSVPEKQPAGTEVGTLSTMDPNASAPFVYTLVGGEGSADNTSFTITADVLCTAASFDFKVKSMYRIRVRSTDKDGLWVEKTFPISVESLTKVGLAWPNGGEFLGTGEPHSIQWVAGPGVETVRLYISSGGRIWKQIAPHTNASLGEVNWTPMGVTYKTVKRKYRMKIVGYAAGRQVSSNESGGTFGIGPLDLTFPRRGSILVGGAQVRATWERYTPTARVAYTKLSYSLNKGSTWKSVMLPGNPGQYDWRVPLVRRPATKGLVRVQLFSMKDRLVGEDKGEGFFTILPRK